MQGENGYRRFAYELFGEASVNSTVEAMSSVCTDDDRVATFFRDCHEGGFKWRLV